jgi:hypothetical protein
MTEKRNLDGTAFNIDVNKALKEKKKKEIIDIYEQETNLPRAMLEQIYSFCETCPEKKLKQIKKGQYKNKTFNPKRPEIVNGMIFETCNVRDLTEEEMRPTVIEHTEDKITEVV